MILNRQPLSLAEVKYYIKDSEEKKIVDYLKKFSNLDSKKASKIVEEIKALVNLKIKDEHIVKIIDFLPQDVEDVNRIFFDVRLTEEEINAILNITKNY